MENYSENSPEMLTPEESEKMRQAKEQYLVIDRPSREKLLVKYREMIVTEETPKRLKMMLREFLDWAEYQNEIIDSNGEIKS